MTFPDQLPASADAKDGGLAKPQTLSFADEIAKALSTRPNDTPAPAKAKPQDGKTAEPTPKAGDQKGVPTTDSKGKTPETPGRPISDRLMRSSGSQQQTFKNLFQFTDESGSKSDLVLPVKPPAGRLGDGKPAVVEPAKTPASRAVDGKPTVVEPVKTPAGRVTDGKPAVFDPAKPTATEVKPVVAPKAPEKAPATVVPTTPVDARPLVPRPGLPSSGVIKLPSLSRDRILTKPEKPPTIPIEPVRPSTTVIVPKRDPGKPPVAGTSDTSNPPAVEIPKAPPVVDKTKPPSIVDKNPPASADRIKPPTVAKPQVPDNPYKPLPKVDYLRQQGSGVDATKTTPDGAPPKYPGPAIDQDKWVMKKLLKPSRLGSALYDLYLATATDRSEENNVPDGIRIAELHKGIKEKVASIELLGDSEMFQPDRHDIVLHPTGRRHPGNFYAVLRDDKGIPINVIEYSKTGGNGKPKYLQQWIFDREADPDTGGRKTTISYFRESSSTAMGRPGVENKTMADVYMGRTEYLASKDGYIVKATQFDNLNKAKIEIDFSTKTPTMQIRDSNSGRMTTATYSKAFTTNMAFSGVYVK